MLDNDYQSIFGKLIHSLADPIDLGDDAERFFEESGPIGSRAVEDRVATRTKVRTRGLLFPISPLPAFPRSLLPITIYTRDFCKAGFGFVAPVQFFPGEVVRVVLATFWMDLRVRRGRRLTETAFETGGILLARHEPSMKAFRAELTMA